MARRVFSHLTVWPRCTVVFVSKRAEEGRPVHSFFPTHPASLPPPLLCFPSVSNPVTDGSDMDELDVAESIHLLARLDPGSPVDARDLMDGTPPANYGHATGELPSADSYIDTYASRRGVSAPSALRAGSFFFNAGGGGGGSGGSAAGTSATAEKEEEVEENESAGPCFPPIDSGLAAVQAETPWDRLAWLDERVRLIKVWLSKCVNFILFQGRGLVSFLFPFSSFTFNLATITAVLACLDRHGERRCGFP